MLDLTPSSCCGANYLFSVLSEGAGVPTLDRMHEVPCSHSGKCWVSVHHQNNGLPLIGRPGIPALGQERLDSSAGWYSRKCWPSVYLGGTGLLVLPVE
jgi:hypothetical protein